EIGMDVNYDLYTLSLDKDGAEPKNITPDNPANDTNPVYSPDGKSILFLRQTIKYFYADTSYLLRYNLAIGHIDSWGPTLDRSFSGFGNDGKDLMFEVEDRGRVRLVTNYVPIIGDVTLPELFPNGCTDRLGSIASNLNF